MEGYFLLTPLVFPPKRFFSRDFPNRPNFVILTDFQSQPQSISSNSCISSLSACSLGALPILRFLRTLFTFHVLGRYDTQFWFICRHMSFHFSFSGSWGHGRAGQRIRQHFRYFTVFVLAFHLHFQFATPQPLSNWGRPRGSAVHSVMKVHGMNRLMSAYRNIVFVDYACSHMLVHFDAI